MSFSPDANRARGPGAVCRSRFLSLARKYHFYNDSVRGAGESFFLLGLIIFGTSFEIILFFEAVCLCAGGSWGAAGEVRARVCLCTCERGVPRDETRLKVRM